MVGAAVIVSLYDREGFGGTATVGSYNIMFAILASPWEVETTLCELHCMADQPGNGSRRQQLLYLSDLKDKALESALESIHSVANHLNSKKTPRNPRGRMLTATEQNHDASRPPGVDGELRAMLFGLRSFHVYQGLHPLVVPVGQPDLHVHHAHPPVKASGVWRPLHRTRAGRLVQRMEQPSQLLRVRRASREQQRELIGECWNVGIVRVTQVWIGPCQFWIVRCLDSGDAREAHLFWYTETHRD